MRGVLIFFGGRLNPGHGIFYRTGGVARLPQRKGNSQNISHFRIRSAACTVAQLNSVVPRNTKSNLMLA